MAGVLKGLELKLIDWVKLELQLLQIVHTKLWQQFWESLPMGAMLRCL